MEDRCENCRWFYSPAIYGKHRVDCQTLGSKRTDSICESFLPTDTVEEEITLANALSPRVITDSDERKRRLLRKVKLGNLEDFDYYHCFRQIIQETYILEQAAEEAPKSVRVSLQQTGQDLDLNSLVFNKYTNKLVDVVLLYKLCMLYGLGKYVDEIVQLEIENKFKKQEE